MGARSNKSQNIPVIAAIGETLQRPTEIADAKEPIDLMADAMWEAEQDARVNLLDELDQVTVIGVVSWRYKDPAVLLCERLGIYPKNKVKAGMGGDKPVRHIHEAALAIQDGKLHAVAIVGGEAQNSHRRARRAGLKLPWTDKVSTQEAWGDITDTSLGIRRQAREIGVRKAIDVYPLFENAYSASLGQTPTEAICASADLWATYSAESATNSYAWSQTPKAARDLATITEINRLIGFPYPKWMVANDSVNQSAAIVVTSLDFARAHGIPDDQLVYIHGGFAAHEPDDFLTRNRYDEYPAMDAVLSATVDEFDDIEKLTLAELYSCFPIVPKAARDKLTALGTKPELLPTVTGGLPFFGGPMNNYMTHAACAMTRKLRDGVGERGLLYAQGGAMTKHHTLIFAKSPPNSLLQTNYSVQAAADLKRGRTPTVSETYNGPAEIETYTALYNGNAGGPTGIVVARTPSGERLIAATSHDDEVSIAALTSFDESAIGLTGDVRPGPNATLSWHMD